jgi:hypothetical protein
MTDKRRNGWVEHYGEIDGRDGLMVGCTCVWVDGWMDVLFVVAVPFFCSNGEIKQMSRKVSTGRKKPADFDERQFVAFRLVGWV